MGCTERLDCFFLIGLAAIWIASVEPIDLFNIHRLSICSGKPHTNCVSACVSDLDFKLWSLLGNISTEQFDELGPVFEVRDVLQSKDGLDSLCVVQSVSVQHHVSSDTQNSDTVCFRERKQGEDVSDIRQ